MTLLELLKAKLGITSTARDVYLQRLIDAAKAEFEKLLGIVVDETRFDVADYICDVAKYKYENRGEQAIPRHLIFRRNQLYVHYHTPEVVDPTLPEVTP